MIGSTWDSDFTERFFVLIEENQQVKRLTPASDGFQCAPPLPAQGEIRIEPKGRTPRGFVSQSLRYTLLPTEVRIKWPDGLLASGEEALIKFQPPQSFQACRAEKRIKPAGPGCWRVPPEVEFVEGRVSYQSRFTFPVYGAIHRFKIGGPTIKDRILWRESFTQKSQLILHLSPQQVGPYIEIGLLQQSDLRPSLTLSRVVPKNATLTISTEERLSWRKR
jgi:hypothetical protein